MKALVIEVREWVNFAVGGVALLLAWLWRPRKERRNVTIEAPAAQADWSMPTPTKADLHLAQVMSIVNPGTHAAHPAVLDSMAEVSPYEFPPN